ncbi:ArsC/Spx/MgsR family protein [Enterococcus faecium]|uniref:ArsC/Spx/MgsR family protein n=1 Tax=Enterococcus faecium TaxID=1352 RepID=UPI0015E3B04C|nr:ArsC/Spx/MgsR family protein [Enterococcus faecium]
MNNILYSFKQNRTRDDVINWLIRNSISYKERKVSKSEPLRHFGVINFLKIAENGFEDILKRNLKNVEIDGKVVLIDELSTNQMIDMIIMKPSLLKNPILTDKNKMIAGFQIDNMGMFIPKEVRKIKLEDMIL